MTDPERVLAVLSGIGGDRDRRAIVQDAAAAVELEAQERKLVQCLVVRFHGMGKRSARELLARLGWWLMVNADQKGGFVCQE